MRLRSLAGLTLLLTGCVVGTSAKSYQPAQEPEGAAIELKLDGGHAVEGELLAVQWDSLLVREGSRFVRVPIARLTRTRGPKLNYSKPGLTADLRERLRLISRYPQGVTAELEQRLLAAYGQTAVQAAP
jgi:hypothetical protein